MLQYRNDIILSFDLVYAEPILCEEELRIHGKSGICLLGDIGWYVEYVFVNVFMNLLDRLEK